MQKANIKLMAATNINQNPKDDLQDGDTVWRLPASRYARKPKSQKIGYERAKSCDFIVSLKMIIEIFQCF
jgi:uncharacterized protein (DUF2249 family)